jgi:hypothetical protein
MMKKTLLYSTLTGLLFVSLATPVYANSYKGKDGWYVTYNGGDTLKTNFKTSAMDDTLSALQPGDEAEFTIAVMNDYNTEVDYYMRNRILKSFEDHSVASQGAYSYQLVYTGDDGTEITLYDSTEVGGENTFLEDQEGLHEATDALKDYIYLDTIPSGKQGSIKLKVMLDGETQGNSYQDTLAELQMEFAIELPPENNKKKKPKKSVNTADIANTLPYMIGLTAGGFLFLIILLFRLREEKKEETE